jgi:1-phosphatidylinositol-3-phosphate 5-kinase
MASGGKSGSAFMRSFNDLLVIKKVNIKEFTTFRKFLPKYFTHLHDGSLLVPIYGAYIVTKNSAVDYYIVMQNLFFGMKNWYLYDFKGSVTRRFSKWPVIPLDVNFLIDRNSEPIFCKDNVLKHLPASLTYLFDNNIVDYSLILVV